MYERYFKHAVYHGESVFYEVDRDRLLRWLLKLCFNSGRVHNADVTVLRKYRGYILGHAPLPAPIQIYVHLITPTDFGTSPPTPGHRIIGGNADIVPPTWFRLTQLRINTDLLTDIVQRQIYIDSFCFTVLVPDLQRPDHVAQMLELQSQFESQFPHAASLVDSTPIRVTARQVHVAEALSQHVSNYPTRYGHGPFSQSQEFSAIVTNLVGGDTRALGIMFTREEIEARNTTAICNRLHELVATREAAVAAMQRVTIFTDAYDDDERDIWEIPAAREFVQSVFEECPFLFFLAAPGAKTINLIAACCCRHTIEEDGKMVFENADIARFFEAGFKGLNEVTQRCALSVEVNRAITDDIFRPFRDAQ